MIIYFSIAIGVAVGAIIATLVIVILDMQILVTIEENINDDGSNANEAF